MSEISHGRHQRRTINIPKSATPTFGLGFLYPLHLTWFTSPYSMRHSLNSWVGLPSCSVEGPLQRLGVNMKDRTEGANPTGSYFCAIWYSLFRCPNLEASGALASRTASRGITTFHLSARLYYLRKSQFQHLRRSPFLMTLLLHVLPFDAHATRHSTLSAKSGVLQGNRVRG